MAPEQYAELRESVRQIGLKEPGWTWRGDLVDGVHRERVCDELGLDFPTREWDGKGSLHLFVSALNKSRRHLTNDQRVAIAVELEEVLAKEAKQRQREHGKTTPGKKKTLEADLPQLNGRAPQARDDAAVALGVKPRRVQEQKAIKKDAPDLHAKVKTGELTHAQAQREFEKRQPKPRKTKLQKEDDELKEYRQLFLGVGAAIHDIKERHGSLAKLKREWSDNNFHILHRLIQALRDDLDAVLQEVK